MNICLILYTLDDCSALSTIYSQWWCGSNTCSVAPPSRSVCSRRLLWREIPAGSRVFLVVREAGTSAILAGD